MKDYVRFRHVDEAIASGELQAVSVTAMSYTNGQSVCFFVDAAICNPGERSRRVGVRTGLTVDHLMASSAIPTLFPARKIADGFYGDGAIRQLKPISPALHLGADKVFVIGGDNPIHKNHISSFVTHRPSRKSSVTCLTQPLLTRLKVILKHWKWLTSWQIVLALKSGLQAELKHFAQ
ncbi:MAG: hypothetical protein R3E73_11425 [Porticoccaceae bacterium]